MRNNTFIIDGEIVSIQKLDLRLQKTIGKSDRRKSRIYFLKIVSEMVRDQLDYYSTTKLPEQITLYLNNHLLMDHILREHSNTLTQKLQITAKETLDRLTNEDKFHDITNSYINNIDIRFNTRLEELERGSNLQLYNQNIFFNEELKKMHNKVNRETHALSESNEKLRKLENQVDNVCALAGAAIIIGGIYYSRVLFKFLES